MRSIVWGNKIIKNVLQATAISLTFVQIFYWSLHGIKNDIK